MTGIKDVRRVLKIAGALNSELKLWALSSLCSGPKNLKEVMDFVESKGHKIRYRETMFRSLEKLTDAELIDKTYQREKGIVYVLKKQEIMINFCQ
jgi:hypothetical protein